jgi:hypothetical protein
MTQYTMSVTNVGRVKSSGNTYIKSAEWFMVSEHTFAYSIVWETMLQMYVIITISVRQRIAWQQAMNVSVSNT